MVSTDTVSRSDRTSIEIRLEMNLSLTSNPVVPAELHIQNAMLATEINKFASVHSDIVMVILKALIRKVRAYAIEIRRRTPVILLLKTLLSNQPAKESLSRLLRYNWSVRICV